MAVPTNPEKPGAWPEWARRRSRPSVALLAVVILAGAGCHFVQSTAELPAQAIKAVTPGSESASTVSPGELQNRLMRFTDSFSGGFLSSLSSYAGTTNGPPPVELLQLKIAFLEDTLAIATGPNPVSDLLDMATLVSLCRMRLEKGWIPRHDDPQARALLAVCKESEVEVWQIAASVLTQAQQKELRDAIDVWFKEHMDESRIFNTRALGLAAEMEKSSKSEKSGGTANVFTLLRIDPLSGLDPATRELTEMRLAVERGLYMVQRMPQLVSLQTELLSMQVLGLPEVAQMVTNSTQISASVTRLSDVAEQLPARLEASQGKVNELLANSRQTLEAGRQMSDSLNTTLKTFDALMKRFGVGEPSTSPPDTNSPPFNILDYAKTADQLALASKQLESLLLTFNTTLNSPAWNQRLQDFDAVSRRTQKDADALLNRAFFVGAMLIGVAFVCALVYRFIAVKVIKAPR